MEKKPIRCGVVGWDERSRIATKKRGKFTLMATPLLIRNLVLLVVLAKAERTW